MVPASTVLGSMDCSRANLAPATRRTRRIFECIVAGFSFEMLLVTKDDQCLREEGAHIKTASFFQGVGRSCKGLAE